MYKKLLIILFLIFSFNTITFSQNGKLKKGKERLKEEKTTVSKGKRTVKNTSSRKSSLDDNTYMNWNAEKSSDKAIKRYNKNKKSWEKKRNFRYIKVDNSWIPSLSELERL